MCRTNSAPAAVPSVRSASSYPLNRFSAAGRLPCIKLSMVMFSALQISTRVCRGGRGGGFFHVADVWDGNKSPFRQNLLGDFPVQPVIP